jgi:hypothetical protein
MATNGKMLTGKDILDVISEGGLQLPPLVFTLLSRADIGQATSVGAPPFRRRPETEPNWQTGVVFLRASWQNRSWMFDVTVRNRATPKTFREALLTLQQSLPSSNGSPEQRCRPLLVVPYLSEGQLKELERLVINGVDLCGNGIVTIPGELLVYRTGNPNRYRQSFPIRNVYGGNSAVVARVFLARPEYAEVGDILREVRSRGATVAISTVSKVLKRLEEDLVVGRESGKIRLLQPDTLLQNLVEDYRPPRVTRRYAGKCSLPIDNLMQMLSNRTPDTGVRVALTGLSSVNQYGVMARENKISLYCTSMAALLDVAGPALSEGERFANIEIQETRDEAVYLDVRKEQGYPWASPVQVYLELMQGDKRDADTAEQVKRVILNEIATVSGTANDV